jgi:heme A synthase
LLTGTLFLLQLFIGTINLLLLAPVWLQLVHLLVADLVWISLILLTAAVLGDRRRAVDSSWTPEYGRETA